MSSLFMNSLYSSDYKKEKKKKKKTIKFVDENMGDAGYRTRYVCSAGYKR